MKKKTPNGASLVICVANSGFPASLEPRKIYRCLGSVRAGRNALLRVVDESGEEYLYPKRLFASVRLPASVRQALALAS
jgi:hypothetical protein